ncbi:hypothetical protein [Haloarchaeobius sp. TZWWS8]|uniref:hypothetical protein n=1 Tax=Haloarchaeobius sp. TZWWS8 TaxID=3446121 RepID=UPI003EBF2C56
MRYDELYLDVQLESAHRRILDRVSDIRSRRRDGRVEYRTNTGTLLATLSATVLDSGEQGSKLRYRTTLISAPMAHARTQAQAIRRAVDEFRTTDGTKPF